MAGLAGVIPPGRYAMTPVADAANCPRPLRVVIANANRLHHFEFGRDGSAREVKSLAIEWRDHHASELQKSKVAGLHVTAVRTVDHFPALSAREILDGHERIVQPGGGMRTVYKTLRPLDTTCGSR